jgi:hypothetical protein
MDKVSFPVYVNIHHFVDGFVAVIHSMVSCWLCGFVVVCVYGPVVESDCCTEYCGLCFPLVGILGYVIGRSLVYCIRI